MRVFTLHRSFVISSLRLRPTSTDWNVFSTLTAWYSSVISVTFTRKGLHELVWDADTVFAARVHVTGLADTL